MTEPALLLFLALAALPPSEAPDLSSKLSESAIEALTKSGVVLLLPQRNANPFQAVLASQTQERCAKISEEMVHPERWPKRFPRIRDDVEVLSRKSGIVRYQFRVEVPFSPTIDGVVRRPAENLVLFGEKDEGVSRFDLVQKPHGRQITYRIARKPGEEADFVSLVRHVEDGSRDAVELASALATLRGWTPARASEGLSEAGRVALAQLARHGTAVHISANGERWRVVGRRVIALPRRTVEQRLRDRARYAKKTDFFNEVERQGVRTEWHFAYFGGRVNFVTQAKEKRSAKKYEVSERVFKGDLKRGNWRWTVQEVTGGSDVQLELDLDVVEGSRVLRMIVGQDETLRESAKMQLLLGLLVDVVGGEPLGQEAPQAPLTSELTPSVGAAP